MMMMCSANELISLYLGVELQSLALYVIATMNRDDEKSAEAGLKYFVLGALSSGMLLYGMSLVYGFTGSVTFPAIRQGGVCAGWWRGRDVRPRLHCRGPRLQDERRAVPHVDARRL